MRILHTVQACAERGWNNVMVLSAMPSDDALVKPFTYIGCEIVLHPRASRNFDAKCVSRTYRLLHQKKCDIFHCQNVHTSPLIAAALARVPVRIWSKLSMSADYETGDTPKGIHRWAPSTRLSCLLAHRTLCISATVRDELLGLGISPNELLVTPAPVDVERYRNASPEGVREKLGLSSEHTVIVAVGRAVPVKGWDVLLRTFAKVVHNSPSARLLLVGDTQGPQELPTGQQLFRLASELGITDTAVFLGARNDIPKLLSASDIFVLPSRSEGMPSALIEALAAGLPAVAADVGGVPEIIVDRVNGLLFERENEKALANMLNSLINDLDWRRSFRKPALKSSERFSLKVATDNMMALYDDLLDKAGDHAPGRSLASPPSRSDRNEIHSI
jgi:glycosyltransferase involved in cell wall biosynthesis